MPQKCLGKNNYILFLDFLQVLYLFVVAAITWDHKFSGLKQQKSFSEHSEILKSEIRVTVVSVSSGALEEDQFHVSLLVFGECLKLLV